MGHEHVGDGGVDAGRGRGAAHAKEEEEDLLQPLRE
jgi:hypothetical protein